MEYISGNIFIRPNVLGIGGRVDGHVHNFDHTTFALKGWFMIRGISPTGTMIINQFASSEYSEVRRLQLKYEPERVMRPVRFDDIKQDIGGGKFKISFHVGFIKQGEEVPDGAEEIEFSPIMSHRLVLANVEHEIISLTESSEFHCVYSHRTHQGEISQTVTGWYGAYA